MVSHTFDESLLFEEPPLAEAPRLIDERRTSGARPAGVDELSLTRSLAVRDEQAARGHAMVWICLWGALALATAIQIPARRPPGHWLTTGALIALALVSVALLVEARDRRGVDSGRMLALGLVATATALLVVFYAGPFSPATLALFLGVYYFGQSDERRHGWIIFSFCIIGFVTLASLATVGVIDVARSLIPVARPETSALAIAAFVVAAFLTLTFWLARNTRAATLRAMARLESARRQLRQREALLDEARADLRQVLDARGAGRHSGTSVAGYVLGELIGRGAMGEVYAATEPESGNPVAVKLLHPFVLDDPTHVQRFLREAEVASALDSIHIAKVSASGFTEDGCPYLVMERLLGHDLAWYLRERRRLPLEDVLDLVSQVAAALAVAQDAGIVHRDLKPQNLFLAELGGGRVWKVLDFGVSKLRGPASNLTQGAAVGTPSYMAPEQALGLDVDHRADVFGLGVIAYRCLTGRPAFTSTEPMATMSNVVHAQPARPREHVLLHEDVELALAIALAKDRNRRYPSATTFATALGDAARGQLDERLRRDARALLAEHPWGAVASQPRLESRR